MKYAFCEGCVYDHENKDGGCDNFTEREFLCPAYTDAKRKTELDLLEKAYKNSKAFYLAYDGACGKFCQNP
jgi:hypothetical protein